jgi:hypothetical protein
MNVSSRAGYYAASTYILCLDLSVLKAAGKPEHALPLDVRAFSRTGAWILMSSYYAQIIVETLVALVLGTVGASLDAPPLREITWASELRTRCVFIFVICTKSAERSPRAGRWRR